MALKTNTAVAKSNGKAPPPKAPAAKAVATKAPVAQAKSALKPEAANRLIPGNQAPRQPSTAVTVLKKDGALAKISDDTFSGMASSGLENVTQSDVIIPRITILQALSPQLQKSKPEFNPDAQQGDFCDTATGALYRDEITLIPCFFARIFIEWAPRSTGKGLVKNHGLDASILDQCTPDEKGRMILPNGNYVAETATYYCLNLSAGGARCFVPLTSTQLRASRRWMTLITAEKIQRADGSVFTPPIFYRSWRASTVNQTNNEGDWFGWKFEAADSLPEMEDGAELLAEAKAFYEQARNGLVIGDISSMAADEAQANTGTGDAM